MMAYIRLRDHQSYCIILMGTWMSVPYWQSIPQTFHPKPQTSTSRWHVRMTIVLGIRRLSTMSSNTKSYQDISIWIKMVDQHCNPKSHAAQSELWNIWLNNSFTLSDLTSSSWYNSKLLMRLLAKLYLECPLSFCFEVNRQRHDKYHRKDAKKLQNILD